MRPIALVWLLVTGCAPMTPGQPLTGWERATDPSPLAEAPERVPSDLAWSPVADPHDLVFADAERTLYLRARARCETSWRDPVVFAPKTYVGLAAYWRGERVGPRVSYRYASGTPWYAIPIDCDADLVVFRLESRYTQIGFPEAPRTGERATFVGQLVPRDAPRIVLAVLFLFLGLVSGLLAIGSRERRALGGLAVYGVALAAWTLFHTRTKQLWFDSMEVWFGIWWVSVPMIAFGAGFFVDGFFGPGRGRLVRLLWIGLAFTTVAAALSLFLHGDAFRTSAAPIFVAGRGLTVLGTVLVVVELGRLARRGDQEAAILLAGLVLAFFTVLHDIALSLGWIEGDDTWTQYGYALFGVTLALLVRRRIATLQRELAEHADSLDRYVRERDVLMRDLHDGLGGIVTNVRMLAEQGADEAPSTALGAISKLAAEGVNELRTLIFGFDGPPQTWRQVAAELRRAGGVAIEAHGIEHRFEHRIAEDAPRPEIGTVVHLVRIHREALTNALKHADARVIEVRLEVSAEQVELVVADDGHGLREESADRGGVDLGKGLASMRGRARELSGVLEIETEGGTRVRLTAPLGRTTSPR